VSASWARQIADWSGRLPAGHRDDADQILLDTAAGRREPGGPARAGRGNVPPHLPARPRRPRRRLRRRSVTLDLHHGGAGRLTGDLTPECAAALQTALDALGKKRGPEDE
jgi:hypothetical protein